MMLLHIHALFPIFDTGFMTEGVAVFVGSQIMSRVYFTMLLASQITQRWMEVGQWMMKSKGFGSLRSWLNFRYYPRNFPEESQENHEKQQSGFSVSPLRFEPETFIIEIRIITVWNALHNWLRITKKQNRHRVGGTRFESRTGYRTSWLNCVWFFRTPSCKCRDSACIRPRPLPSKTFPVHQSSIIILLDVIYKPNPRLKKGDGGYVNE